MDLLHRMTPLSNQTKAVVRSSRYQDYLPPCNYLKHQPSHISNLQPSFRSFTNIGDHGKEYKEKRDRLEGFHRIGLNITTSINLAEMHTLILRTTENFAARCWGIHSSTIRAKVRRDFSTTQSVLSLRRRLGLLVCYYRSDCMHCVGNLAFECCLVYGLRQATMIGLTGSISVTHVLRRGLCCI